MASAIQLGTALPTLLAWLAPPPPPPPPPELSGCLTISTKGSEGELPLVLCSFLSAADAIIGREVELEREATGKVKLRCAGSCHKLHEAGDDDDNDDDDDDGDDDDWRCNRSEQLVEAACHVNTTT